MFWRLGLHYQESNVNKLLERENCSLEDLLDDDEILTECKAHNDKLVKYLAKPEVVEKLIDLLTVVPEGADEKRTNKYPHLACEVMCCDINEIWDVFLDSPALLQRFLTFLNSPPPLNPGLTGYFHRVFVSLLTRKPGEVIKCVQATESGWASAMLRHIGSFGIPDLLLRLMGADAGSDEMGDLLGAMGMGMSLAGQLRVKLYDRRPTGDDESLNSEENIKWWMDQNVIERLLDRLSASEESEVHANISSLLCDMMKRFSGNAGDVVMSRLLSDDVVSRLLERVVNRESSSVLTHGLVVLSELLNSVRSREAESDPDDASSPSSVYLVLGRHMDRLLSLLDAPENPVVMKTTFGDLSPPLGAARLKVIQFFETLFNASRPFLDSRLADIGALKRIIELFFEYEWNNLLHCIVDRTVKRVLSGTNEDLKRQLFADAALPNRILEAHRENTRVCALPKGQRKGYMGHITSISNALVDASSRDELVRGYLDSNADWVAYVQGKLRDTNTVETRALGGGGGAGGNRFAHDDDDTFVADFGSPTGDADDLQPQQPPSQQPQQQQQQQQPQSQPQQESLGFEESHAPHAIALAARALLASPAAVTVSASEPPPAQDWDADWTADFEQPESSTAAAPATLSFSQPMIVAMDVTDEHGRVQVDVEEDGDSDDEDEDEEMAAEAAPYAPVLTGGDEEAVASPSVESPPAFAPMSATLVHNVLSAAVAKAASSSSSSGSPDEDVEPEFNAHNYWKAPIMPVDLPPLT